MKINEAVVLRIRNLCKEQGITINKLASRAGMTQSTLSDLMIGRNKSPKISTLKKICIGLNISLSEFFNDPSIEESDVD